MSLELLIKMEAPANPTCYLGRTSSSTSHPPPTSHDRPIGPSPDLDVYKPIHPCLQHPGGASPREGHVARGMKAGNLRLGEHLLHAPPRRRVLGARRGAAPGSGGAATAPRRAASPRKRRGDKAQPGPRHAPAPPPRRGGVPRADGAVARQRRVRARPGRPARRVAVVTVLPAAAEALPGGPVRAAGAAPGG